MSNIISVTDFRSHVSEIVNRVHYKNETIFLMRGATVVAKITGVEPSYPYARQIKAARVQTGNFVQAVVFDIGKLVTHAVEKVAEGVRFLVRKIWELTLLSIELFKRWVGICLMVEKESWLAGAAGAKRRRAA
jgi:antitoxin (DNA-binding transcriptional repressor) of toxin-antitoxin stability system